MKLPLVFLCCVLAAAVQVGAVEQADETRPNDEELKAAHEALRAAVEKIRVYHEGEGGTYTVHVTNDEEIIADRHRPRLGVVVESDSEGAKIVAVTPAGPADEAGLRSGDVITAVEGRPLIGAPEPPSSLLVSALSELEEGDTVSIGYLRDGNPGTANVVVRPVEFDAQVMSFSGGSGPHIQKNIRVVPGDDTMMWFFPHGWMDMELVALNPDLADYFGTDEGVLVVRAAENEDLGLKGGDVIVSIDNRVVNSPTHAMRILRSYEPEERLTIEIMRHGHRETIEATVPDRQVDLMHGETGYGYEYRWHEKGDE
jgi:S1-C subfamily serine protease